MYTWNYTQDCHGKSSIQEAEGFFTRQLGLNQRKELLNCIVLCCDETWELGKVDFKYLERCEKCSFGEERARADGL